MNFSPGVATGSANPMAYFSEFGSLGGSGRYMGANISSEKGARVASNFDPLTMSPSDVVSTTPRAM